jgi:hypothetical protein
MNALATALILLASAGAAAAASVTNNESGVRVLVVTEGANKSQLVIRAGQTVHFCNRGCFVTFPNGDRQALMGSDAVELTDGKVIFK